MVAQLQILNKILQTKDMSLIILNNLTEDYFFGYQAEFKYIKNHYDLYNTVPDRLSFVNVFNDFDIIDVTEPDNYLLEQLYKDFNAKRIATSFVEIRRLLEDDDVDTIAGLVVKELGRLAQLDDVVKYHEFTFTVKEVDGARITKLLVVRDESQETTEQQEG